MTVGSSSSSGFEGADRLAERMIDGRGGQVAALTLLFAAGQRPDAAAVARLAARPAENTTFRISHAPVPDEGWLELLAFGLTFDLAGLAPLGPAAPGPTEHLYGLDRATVGAPLEVIRLVAAPHISAGRTLEPVIRVMVGLGAELARLPGLRAVGWEPARSLCAPAYFIGAIRAWLAGGPFPALGLTALDRAADGSLTSVGLDQFCGAEVRVEPLAGEDPAAFGKLAVRVIDAMATGGPAAVAAMLDAAGRRLAIEPNRDATLYRVWRRG